MKSRSQVILNWDKKKVTMKGCGLQNWLCPDSSVGPPTSLEFRNSPLPPQEYLSCAPPCFLARSSSNNCLLRKWQCMPMKHEAVTISSAQRSCHRFCLCPLKSLIPREQSPREWAMGLHRCAPLLLPLMSTVSSSQPCPVLRMLLSKEVALLKYLLHR